MLRYKRQLSERAFHYLLKEGRFIISEIKLARQGDIPFGLDIQIRENDTLEAYRGNTCLLKIKIDCTSRTLTFSADKAYSSEFLGKYDFNSTTKNGIVRYLQRTVPHVASKYFSNQKEGYFQNLICFLHGEKADNESPFIIFDRECVIGFGKKEEKDNFLKPITDHYQDIRNNLQKDNSKTFGQPKNKSLGNELDLLAIDKEMNLLCIELKHGTYGSGIYWGPLQVAVYKELFGTSSLDGFFGDVKDLVLQKVALGLLPDMAGNLFRGYNKFKDIISALAIAEPNSRKSCWRLMDTVIKKEQERLTCDMYSVDKNGHVSKLVIGNFL